MAIVNMNKITIIGLEADKEKMLKHLQSRGFVQIDDSAYLTEEEELSAYLSRDGNESAVIELDQKLYQIQQAIELVTSAAKVKKPFLAPKRDFSMPDTESEESTLQAVEKVLSLSKQTGTLKSNINACDTNKALLTPWVDLDIPLGKMQTKYARTILGTLPIISNPDAVRQKLSEAVPESILGVVSADKTLHYVYIICLKSVFDNVTEVLKDFSFSAVSLTEDKTTPKEAMKSYEDKKQALANELANVNEEIKSYSKYVHAFENLYDSVTFERDRKKIAEKLVRTKSTFYLNGWLPTKRSEKFIQELTAEFECYIETEETSREDNFPILLENNSIVTPFESITNMYSTPGPRDIDPNGIMAVFYIIFFGMMLSDAGYGIIIALACLFVVKKGKMKKGQGNLFKMIGICGISTTIWGLIFGSIFGDMFPIKALISPLDDVMVLMGMSLLFGIIHIYVGLGIKAYVLVKEGHPLDALFDVGLWYFFITGVCLLVLPVVAGDVGILSQVGLYFSIIGAVGLILTQGRQFKGIFMKGFKGVSSLYGITSYFADILSYSRLMALCLSTGVISQVINLLGKIAGPVPAIIIGIIGHTANLAINALGAYVHTSRLQYVEFFGKFYEGGGEAFVPFQYKTKYTTINEEEM